YLKTGVAAVTGFNVYASQEGPETGQRRYFAVYRKDTYVEAATVGTGDYFDFGFGGAQYSRTSDSVDLPINSGEAVYNGRYGGTRVQMASGGTEDITLVEGDATITVDFLDFENRRAVEGKIENRRYYSVNGDYEGVLPTIFLDTTNFGTDGFIEPGVATTYEGDSIEPYETGTYEGVFAGPNGEQITGVIIIEDTNVSREIGVFTVTD
ncbi:MAG: hypothetical protein CL813_15700, partial [Confluentimicrobium sp.]|nr:hypothetical protein [Actibacterium sp.]